MRELYFVQFRDITSFFQMHKYYGANKGNVSWEVSILLLRNVFVYRRTLCFAKSVLSTPVK